ncbi:MAG: hypothetical protein ACREPA_04535 [Candidatus Dormibacteraceae bacterium]
MSPSFLRREWGAATFVITVLVGVIVVPVALYFGHQPPAQAAPRSPTPTVSATAGPRPSPGVKTSPRLSPSAHP